MMSSDSSNDAFTRVIEAHVHQTEPAYSRISKNRAKENARASLFKKLEKMTPEEGKAYLLQRYEEESTQIQAESVDQDKEAVFQGQMFIKAESHFNNRTDFAHAVNEIQTWMKGKNTPGAWQKMLQSLSMISIESSLSDKTDDPVSRVINLISNIEPTLMKSLMEKRSTRLFEPAVIGKTNTESKVISALQNRRKPH